MSPLFVRSAARAAVCLALWLGCKREAPEEAAGKWGATVAASGQPAAPDAGTPDSRLAAAIRASFARDPALRSQSVKVQVADGAVTLDGSVPTLAARWRAVQLVQAFRGAISLADTLRVTPNARGDAEIARDAQQALARDPATRDANVEATASDAVVTLRGAADSYVQRRLLAIAVASVRGVRAVDLAVTVSKPAARTDAELAADVLGGFADDARLGRTHLTVEVHGQDVVVAGVVGSLAQRVAALQDAEEAGAAKVDGDAVRIDASLRGVDLGAAVPRMSDAHVADGVRRALSGDPRLKNAAPTVSVHLGGVTLSGKVTDFRAKKAASRDARGVSGVMGVDDRMTVLPVKTESDASIQTQAAESVYSESLVPDARDVLLTTRNARVTLRGHVASPEERATIQADVEEVPGVVAVDNGLEVTGYGPKTSAVSADTIRHDIIEAIYWDARVETGRVTVSALADGNVTLTGTVDSLGESQAADEDAMRAGAAHVDNRIQVLGP
jgi:osmotically-inducible protein OsmY